MSRLASDARPAAALLVAALAFSACGDDDDDRGDVNIEGGTDTGGQVTTGAETTPMPLGKATQTIRVRETEFKLDPKNPRIAKTGVVSFRVTNAGDITHALEVEGPSGEQETDSIEPGGSATLKVLFNKEGRYKWYCPIGDHEQDGMVGTIIVGSGSGERGTDDKGGSSSRGEDEQRREDDNSGRGGGVSGY